MSFARTFGAFAASLRPEDVPPEIDAEARRCILDTVGVAVAGLAHPTCVAARRFATSFLGSRLSAVPGETSGAPATSAFLIGTAAHAWDYDDTSYMGIVHASAVVLPAVLAVAPLHDISDAEARTAFIAGVETVYALGEALTNATYFDGWWTTGLFGTVGAAAGAARAMRLDVDGCASAIAHAAVLATGCRAVLGTAAKPLGCGHAARLGVEAAGLAAAGLDSPFDAIEHARGFAVPRGRFPQPVTPPCVNASLVAATWRILSPGVARKLFPACSAMQAAGEALRDLMRDHRVTAVEIRSIECGAPRLVVESLVYDKPRHAAEAQFSMHASLACIALSGDFTIGHLASGAWRAPEAQALMERITLSLEPEAFDQAASPEGAVLRVTLSDGKRLEKFSPVATGMPARPMPERDLVAKFEACTAPTVGTTRSRNLCTRILTGGGASVDLLQVFSE